MPHKDPATRKTYMNAYNSARAGAQRIYHADWVTKNRPKYDKARAEWHYRTKFGLSLREIAQMLVDQDGVCKICGVDKPGGRGWWHVDHDHATNKVRGLLCLSCNMALGQYEKWRFAFAAYLENAK